jgi:pantothenate kinase
MAESTPPTLALDPEAAVAFLAAEARALADRIPGRIAMGLAGGPGVGKSTLASQLVATLNGGRPGFAGLVPMDGFHMRHAKLEALGLAAAKGAPHTFEGAAFADFLARLKVADKPVAGPGYSREIEDVVQESFIIDSTTRVLVVEGNYLLLPQPPWNRVRTLLDSAVFIGVPREEVRRRLLRRHAEHGLFSEERIREHVERVDLSNYDLVAASRPRADIAIDIRS